MVFTGGEDARIYTTSWATSWRQLQRDVTLYVTNGRVFVIGGQN